MEVQLQTIISACIVYLGLTSVQPRNENTEQSSFSSIAKYDTHIKKNGISLKILKQGVSKERQVFDTMKEELRLARNRNDYKKRNSVQRSKAKENMVVVKRETHEEKLNLEDHRGLAGALKYKNSERRIVRVVDVGRQSYASGLKIQEFVLDFVRRSTSSSVQHQRSNDGLKGVIILIEHDPVYTVGMRDREYDAEYENRLRSLGADFCRTNRGGLVTFHGPGQLVVYPILNLNTFEPNLQYVSLLERVMVSTCTDFGVRAHVSPGTRGVWVENRKIGAIGVRFNQNVTSHGLAFNCETDLKWFDKIVPCGIPGKGVTSLTVECGRRISVAEVHDPFLKNFARLFDCRLEYSAPEFVREILSESK